MTSFSPDFTLDLRRLRLLRELDEHGTVTAAAAALHLSPSAVSQQISGLSRDVGVPLLERHGRGVRLTGQARVLLGHASVMQERIELARVDLAAWHDGTLGQLAIGSLSTGITGLVAPLISRMRRQRPGLDLRAVEMEAPRSFRALDRGELDIAIAIDYRDAPSRRDPRYHRIDLHSDRLDVAMAADHPLADPRGVSMATLADEAWVGTRPEDPCAQITLAVCATAGFSPDLRHRAAEWNSVVGLVAAGAGLALVPRLAHPLPLSDVVFCPVLDVPASRLVFAAARAGSQAAPAISAVMDALVEIAAVRAADEDELRTRRAPA
ncbi:MAG: LysR family transcriptional regulator [Jatrophihabitans sp.]